MIYVRSIWYDITLTFDPSVPDRNQGGMQSGGVWSLHGDGFLLQPPPEENRVSFLLHLFPYILLTWKIFSVV